MALFGLLLSELRFASNAREAARVRALAAVVALAIGVAAVAMLDIFTGLRRGALEILSADVSLIAAMFGWSLIARGIRRLLRLSAKTDTGMSGAQLTYFMLLQAGCVLFLIMSLSQAWLFWTFEEQMLAR